MNPQLTYLIVQARHSELVCRAEQARPAGEARRARSPSFPRRYVGRLLATRRLRPSRLASRRAARKLKPAARVSEL